MLAEGSNIYQVSSSMGSIPSGQLIFDKVNLYQPLPNETYDAITSSLTILQTGLYWFQLSVGIPDQTKASCTIVGFNNKIGVVKDNTAYRNDQVTSDGLSWIANGTKLSVVTNYNLFSSSSVGETAWLWFRLDTAMQQLVAFYVVKTTALNVILNSNTFVQMTYDKIIINEGNGWSVNANAFVAPKTGYYFFSFGVVASSAYHKSCLKLALTSNTSIYLVSNIIYETSVHNGVETARSSVMLSLNANIGVASYAYDEFNYNPNGLNSYAYMQGFFYNPSAGPKVAWSVVRKLGNFQGPSDPVQFDTILVNEGSPWNNASNIIIIPSSGLYLIDLTTYLSGHTGNGNENVQVILNNNPVIVIRLNTVGFNDAITRSRSILIQLNVGDMLRVVVPTSGSSYISGNLGLHAFTGFLLYSTN